MFYGTGFDKKLYAYEHHLLAYEHHAVVMLYIIVWKSYVVVKDSSLKHIDKQLNVSCHVGQLTFN